MSDLTPEQSAAMDFLGEQSNELTREGNLERWKGNIVKNREFFSKGNPSIPGMAAFVVAAGPSLEKNVEALKAVSGRGVIVVLDAALRFVLSRGIKPEFCMMIDGSAEIGKMIEGCDTEGITLVCTPSSSPECVAAWKGPRYFVNTPASPVRRYNFTPLTRIVKAVKDIKEGDLLFLDESYKVEFGGVEAKIMCGGNVSTAAHSFANNRIGASKVIFCGLDLSWKFDSHHYAGHEHAEGARQRTMGTGGEHCDVNGERVLTNLSLLAFKRWHEQVAGAFPGSVVNATEGGILGVKQDGSRLESIEYLTLAEAVAKYAGPSVHEGGRLLAGA